MKIEVLQKIKEKIRHLKTIEDGFYAERYKDVEVTDSFSIEDFEALPFTDKADLRDAYPLGIMACPEEKVVRIHSSSGTTGTPVIIPYTQKDIDDWTLMFKRCYEMTGVGNMDRVHITPGYGLWTAGISFQAGAEAVGAMAIPMGPGNTDKQLKMMMDLKSTVLCSTSSYALLLAERIEQMGIGDKIHLHKGLIGSEQWGEKMRRRISDSLGAKLYDIYGLTEIYGPGVAISCDYETGMHYWDDFFYFEIIDPNTGKVLPFGEEGELVITTLEKEGAPLIRYRTHDLTHFENGSCPCGSPHPRIATLKGRTDDMFKVKGVNMFPAQVAEVLGEVAGVSSEYQVMIDHLNGRDILTLYFEVDNGQNKEFMEAEVADHFKRKIGIGIFPKAVDIGELPRSEKKTTRIYDNRY
ncbi:MAG: phenylacetate--CoA ligase [Tissierellia bacterium]|nr:phenylacetate--CoA ligase [Tissierellia bacterium]